MTNEVAHEQLLNLNSSPSYKTLCEPDLHSHLHTMEQIAHSRHGNVTFLIDADSPFVGRYFGLDKLGYVHFRHEGKEQILARVILGLKIGDPRQGHHKDDNPRNNTRANLQIVTKAENERYKGPQRKSATGLKGVSKHRNGKYIAKIGERKNGVLKQTHLGYFLTKEAAGLAYDREAIRRFADCYLNFPGHAVHYPLSCFYVLSRYTEGFRQLPDTHFCCFCVLDNLLRWHKGAALL